MSQVANHVTPQIQYDYLRAFGLGQLTGIGLPGETAGDLPPVSQWAADTRYTLSFGQGVAVTALQMARCTRRSRTAACGSSPTLIEGTTNSAGTYTPAAPSPSRRVIQANTAHELLQILQQVPGIDEEGDQPWGIIPGYAIAAKTGTSQESNGTCALCVYGSSYIGMAPGNDPQIVVAVNVQNPRKGGYFGDVVAGPVFYQVMKDALATLQIPPDGATAAERAPDRAVMEVPSPRGDPSRPSPAAAAVRTRRAAGRSGWRPQESHFPRTSWGSSPGSPSTPAWCEPGDLYVALPGAQVHGAAFCADAVAAGAVAVLTDPDGRARAMASGVPVFVLADPRARLGEVACWVYGDPSRRLRLIGVTGTSGKTTTTYLLESGLRAAGHLTGLIGGVETRIGTDRLTSSLTTPEAPDLQALFAVMAERGVTAAAMEVSSHSLTLGRVAGTTFDVAVFTNLSQDHLDFHGDLEEYFRAKASLFAPPQASSASSTSTTSTAAGSRLPRRCPVTTFSATGRHEADWRATDVRSGADGSTFRVIGPGGVEADVSVGLAGVFNVANALGALVALVEAGVSAGGRGGRPGGVPGRARAGWSGCPPPGSDVTAFVDYSHKPGAVEAVLRSLRPVTPGNLIIVLGCGGDRDRGKRPMMGAAAASLADVAILTSDNPRSEDPLAILAAMLDGVLSVPQDERARVIIEPDRAAAIAQAVSLAAAGDVIVVAGKGHETGQYVAGAVLPFDDRRSPRRPWSSAAKGQSAADCAPWAVDR